ncbi:MAG: arginyltransferase [Pelagibacterales bacterium]|nr:arginyltransferase [Pelagibacterales bacterium]
MTISIKKPLQIFYGTSPQMCAYLPEKDEKKIITEISGPNSNEINFILTNSGFRRSHRTAYRPACNTCNACIPVRIDIKNYIPNRSTKRAKKKASDLTYLERPPIATREQFDLFTKYQNARHYDSDMASMNFSEYRAMVEDTPVDTYIYEFRDNDNNLVAASLTDKVSDGLSGIYKFFHPDRSRDSIGTWLIDWHIEETKKLGLQYVYLGYWIKESKKMAYKSRYSGLQKLVNNKWIDFEKI